MGRSILHRTGEQRPILDKGRGTKALGPSDTSDTGADVRGGPGMGREERSSVGVSTGSNENVPERARTSDAGPDIGDAGLDSETDSSGTGERATAGRDVDQKTDIKPDRIEGGRGDAGHSRRRRTLRSLRRRRNSKKA